MGGMLNLMSSHCKFAHMLPFKLTFTTLKKSPWCTFNTFILVLSLHLCDVSKFDLAQHTDTTCHHRPRFGSLRTTKWPGSKLLLNYRTPRLHAWLPPDQKSQLQWQGFARSRWKICIGQMGFRLKVGRTMSIQHDSHVTLLGWKRSVQPADRELHTDSYNGVQWNWQRIQ